MADVDLYLLRVWKRLGREKGFRAALRPVAGEAAEVFSDARRLADYVEALAAAPAPADAAGAAPPPQRREAAEAAAAVLQSVTREGPPRAARPRSRRAARARRPA